MNTVMPAVARTLLKHSFLLVYCLAVISWRFLTNTPLTLPIVFTLAGLCVLVHLLTYCSTSLEAAVSAASATEPEQREFVDNPKAVLDAANLTGYDAVRSFAPYLGKWVTISGVYEGSAKSFEQNSIHLSVLLHDKRINLRFGAKSEEQIRRLRAGQRITAHCRIQHRNFTFTPEDCELVQPDDDCGKRSARLLVA